MLRATVVSRRAERIVDHRLMERGVAHAGADDERLPSLAMRPSSAISLMSTRCAGLASRNAMIGTRLWPPASTRPSSGATLARIATASATVRGTWRVNGAGFIGAFSWRVILSENRFIPDHADTFSGSRAGQPSKFTCMLTISVPRSQRDRTEWQPCRSRVPAPGAVPRCNILTPPPCLRRRRARGSHGGHPRIAPQATHPQGDAAL